MLCAGHDVNVNMTGRTESGTSYTLTCEAENRLTGVSGGTSASLVYDGDGNRVKRTLDGVTTIYVGNHYEKNLNTGEVTKYYAIPAGGYAGGQRVATRDNQGVKFIHTDHLRSTTLTTNENGYQEGDTQRYELFGEPRAPVLTGTDRLYTGQRSPAVLAGVFDRDVELMYYGARYPGEGRQDFAMTPR